MVAGPPRVARATRCHRPARQADRRVVLSPNGRRSQPRQARRSRPLSRRLSDLGSPLGRGWRARHDRSETPGESRLRRLDARPGRAGVEKRERAAAGQPVEQQRPADSRRGDDQRQRANVGYPSQFDQRDARGRHRQEERQIDDQRMAAAIGEPAHRAEPGESSTAPAITASAPAKPKTSVAPGSW